MVVHTLTRRDFLRGTLSVASLLRVSLVHAAPPRLIPRAVLFDNPDITHVRLSYDGTMLAYIAPREGVRNLWVAPLDDLPAARPVTQELGRGISSFFQWAFTQRHLVFFQDQDGDENWRASSVDMVSGAIVPLTPVRGVRSYQQEVSPHFPTTMLLGHNQRDKRYHDSTGPTSSLVQPNCSMRIPRPRPSLPTAHWRCGSAPGCSPMAMLPGLNAVQTGAGRSS